MAGKLHRGVEGDDVRLWKSTFLGHKSLGASLRRNLLYHPVTTCGRLYAAVSTTCLVKQGLVVWLLYKLLDAQGRQTEEPRKSLPTARSQRSACLADHATFFRAANSSQLLQSSTQVATEHLFKVVWHTSTSHIICLGCRNRSLISTWKLQSAFWHLPSFKLQEQDVAKTVAHFEMSPKRCMTATLCQAREWEQQTPDSPEMRQYFAPEFKYIKIRCKPRGALKGPAFLAAWFCLKASCQHLGQQPQRMKPCRGRGASLGMLEEWRRNPTSASGSNLALLRACSPLA